MRLIIDTDRRALVPFAFGLTGTVSPDFRQGDVEPLELLLVRGSGTGGGLEAVDFPAAGWIAKVALGQLEEKPITGQFRLEFDGDETGYIGAGATTAQDISAALNSLASITAAGGVQVAVVAGVDGEPGASFLIQFLDPGARPMITADSDNIFPRSATVAVEAVAGNATRPAQQLLRFTRAPAALATTFSALPAASASLSSIYAWDGDRAITRLKFSNVLGGSFLLNWHKHGSGDYTASVPYNVTAAGLEEIISTFDNLAGLVSVSAVGFRTFDITVEHQPQATGTNGFFVDATPAVKVPGYSGDISLATVEVEELLAGERLAAATLEVVLEDAGSELTVLQVPATVRNDLFEQTPATPLEFDIALGKTEAAALYLSKAGNLSGLASTSTARANLGIISATTSAEGLVELATTGESVSMTDSVRSVTPEGLLWNRISPGLGLLPGTTSNGLTAGVGAASNASMFGMTCFGPDPGVVGYGGRRFQMNNGAVGSLAREWGVVNFDETIVLAFRLAPHIVSTGSPSNDSVINANYGDLLGTDTGGTLARKGFGLQIYGHNNPLRLTVHDGTTYRTVNSSFTPTSSTTVTTYDFALMSKAGTVNLYQRTSLAGGWSLIATSANGPTGLSAANASSVTFTARNESAAVTSSRWRFLAGFVSVGYSFSP